MSGLLVFADNPGGGGTWDEEPDYHGLFVQQLLRGLRGEADRDSDGVVTLQELVSQVTERVRRETRGLARPEISLLTYDPFWPMAVVSPPVP